MYKKLSIIIPFRNEGIQIAKTIKSLKKWSSPILYDIICINDSSDDEFDYPESLKEFDNVTYIVNEERLGVAGSRDKGVQEAKTQYVLLLDGHMRFFDDIIPRLIYYLETNPRTLLCLQSVILKEKEGKIYCCKHLPFSCGAKIHLDKEAEERFLSVDWEVLKVDNYLEDIIDIPCVLGAGYAIERDYYLHLHGLSGLVVYGCDEAFLSMKVWLEGGRCKLLRELEVGHIYRTESPCGVKGYSIYFNKMLIAELLLPNNLKKSYYKFLKNLEIYEELKKFLNEQKKEIRAEKKYLKNIFKNDFNVILDINKSRKERTYPLAYQEKTLA